MQTLQELKNLANSLDYLDLEPEEQELLDEIDATKIQKTRQGYYTATIWIHEPGGPYATTVKADTLQELENIIIDHYKNTLP